MSSYSRQLHMVQRSICLVLALLLGGARAAPTVMGSEGSQKAVHRGRFLMGTTCRIMAYGPDPAATAAALEAALDAVAQAEVLLSSWREDAEMWRVNRAAAARAVAISPEMAGFLARALALAASTRGAFDPSVGALIDAWDLRGAGRIPSRRALAAALGAVGYRQVDLDPQAFTVRFRAPGLWLDSGGAGKGYALDRAARVLRRRPVNAALLDFGGQVLALGAPPGEDVWTVAVADPGDRDGPALLLSLRDASAATSSQWERGRQVDGRWIGHILDPRSGEPVAWRGSTTVIAPAGMEADALATGLFVLGQTEGLAWASRRGGLGIAYLEPVPAGEGRPLLQLRANDTFRNLLAAVRGDVVHR